MQSIIQKELASHLQAVTSVIASMSSQIEAAGRLVTQTLERGNKVLLLGNGGSAAEAQHIAAELTGRFRCDRAGLPAIALTTDTSALTAIANDYGFENIFSRQIEALAVHHDLVIGYSTSGNSPNVVNALETGRRIGARTIGFTGNRGGQMNQHCDICLAVPSSDAARIQEIHLLLGHVVCHLCESALFPTADRPGSTNTLTAIHREAA